jgi:hypothetical protein
LVDETGFDRESSFAAHEEGGADGGAPAVFVDERLDGGSMRSERISVESI